MSDTIKTTITLDTSRVPLMSERMQSLALFETAVAAERAYDTLRERLIEEMVDRHPDVVAARNAYIIADAAYSDAPYSVRSDDDDQPRRCALSGLPLLYDDDTTEFWSGAAILNALLPFDVAGDDYDDGCASECDGDDETASADTASADTAATA